MNVAATTGANAAIIATLARSKVIEHFKNAGALSAETAVPLPQKHSRSMVKSLIKQKVIVPAGEGLFYLDQEADARSLREQGQAAIAVILAMLVLLAFVVIGLLLTN